MAKESEVDLGHVAQLRNEAMMREYAELLSSDSSSRNQDIREFRARVAQLPDKHRKAVEADMEVSNRFANGRRNAEASNNSSHNPIEANGKKYRLDQAHNPNTGGSKKHR